MNCKHNTGDKRINIKLYSYRACQFLNEALCEYVYNLKYCRKFQWIDQSKVLPILLLKLISLNNRKPNKIRIKRFRWFK